MQALRVLAILAAVLVAQSNAGTIGIGNVMSGVSQIAVAGEKVIEKLEKDSTEPLAQRHHRHISMPNIVNTFPVFHAEESYVDAEAQNILSDMANFLGDLANTITKIDAEGDFVEIEPLKKDHKKDDKKHKKHHDVGKKIWDGIKTGVGLASSAADIFDKFDAEDVEIEAQKKHHHDVGKKIWDGIKTGVGLAGSAADIFDKFDAEDVEIEAQKKHHHDVGKKIWDDIKTGVGLAGSAADIFDKFDAEDVEIEAQKKHHHDVGKKIWDGIKTGVGLAGSAADIFDKFEAEDVEIEAQKKHHHDVGKKIWDGIKTGVGLAGSAADIFDKFDAEDDYVKPEPRSVASNGAAIIGEEGAISAKTIAAAAEAAAPYVNKMNEALGDLANTITKIDAEGNFVQIEPLKKDDKKHKKHHDVGKKIWDDIKTGVGLAGSAADIFDKFDAEDDYVKPEPRSVASNGAAIIGEEGAISAKTIAAAAEAAAPYVNKMNEALGDLANTITGL